jgi:phosphoribosyl 1,2-cyclic phosphodiesterase
MRVTFYGVRGSIPTPGPSTVRYGGNTACVEVRLTDGTLIVLDGGTGIRELGKQILREGFDDPIHLFVSHPHWDHILGIPFFAPLFCRETRLVIYPFPPHGAEQWYRPLIMDGEHFPVRYADIPARIRHVEPEGDEVRVGSARVRRIRLNHPGGSDGFRIDDADGASLCYLTDNELSPPGMLVTSVAELALFARGTGLLIHDAQYLPEQMPAKQGWGHSRVDHVLGLGRAAGARALALYHHDPERDDGDLDRIALDAERWASINAPGMHTIVAREGLSLTVGADATTPIR